MRREKDKSDIASNAIKMVLNCCSKRVESFNTALRNAKPKYEFIKLSNGNRINSLGLARLNIIKLISKMISFGDAKLNEELIKQGTLKIIIVSSFLLWPLFIKTLNYPLVDCYSRKWLLNINGITFCMHSLLR